MKLGIAWTTYTYVVLTHSNCEFVNSRGHDHQIGLPNVFRSWVELQTLKRLFRDTRTFHILLRRLMLKR
jgi:hypothetical protein